MSSPILQTGVMATEPSRVVGLVTSVVVSVFALLVALGLPISDQVQAAILGLIATVGPLVAAQVIRGKVYSPKTVEGLVTLGVESGRQLGKPNSGATLA